MLQFLTKLKLYIKSYFQKQYINYSHQNLLASTCINLLAIICIYYLSFVSFMYNNLQKYYYKSGTSHSTTGLSVKQSI